MKTLEKFSSVHASVHSPFAHERHLVSRKIYRERDGPPHWLPGSPSWPKPRLGLGAVRLGGDKLPMD
jgi:hypothetical protein